MEVYKGHEIRLVLDFIVFFILNCVLSFILKGMHSICVFDHLCFI